MSEAIVKAKRRLIEAKGENTKEATPGAGMALTEPTLSTRPGLAMVDSLIDECDQVNLWDDTAVIDLLHRTQRALKIFITRTDLNAELMEVLDAAQDKSWAEKPLLGVDGQKVKMVARQLFEASKVKSGDKIVIYATGIGREIVEELVRICYANHVDFEFDIYDEGRDAAFINSLDEVNLAKLATFKLSRYENVTCQIMVRAEPAVKPKFDRVKIWEKLISSIRKRCMEGGKKRPMNFTITSVPTQREADIDGVPYQDSLNEYLEAFDQPREEIYKAHEILIEKLNAGKFLRFINNDGTNLTMEITGQTFANSVRDKNLPGTEVFSAPLKESVHGKFVAKGKFEYKTTGIIEDIELHFENGRVVSFKAATPEQTAALGSIITGDDGKGEGSRYVGEIGFGTTPGLKRHTINRILVEKLSRSFHIALGDCYGDKEWERFPVNLSNGNSSSTGTHLVLTVMLGGKEGQIYLDGELIQDDGKWLIPGCEVLNGG